MAARYRIILSKRVAADLEGIFQYIARDSAANASSMVSRILQSIDNLKVFPHRTVVQGQKASQKHPVRSLPVKPFVIFFRVLEENRTVRIVQVRHAAMRRPRRFEP